METKEFKINYSNYRLNKELNNFEKTIPEDSNKVIKMNKEEISKFKSKPKDAMRKIVKRSLKKDIFNNIKKKSILLKKGKI